MVGRLDLNFSVSFDGVIWNMAALPSKKLLILEIRREQRRQVTFSAWNYAENSFLWQDQPLGDAWWSGLVGAEQQVLLVQQFDATGRPDNRLLSAFHVETHQLLWKKENFAWQALTPDALTGYAGTDGDPVLERLDLMTGQTVGENPLPNTPTNVLTEVHKPSQYRQGTPYFETVCTFLIQHCNVHPVEAIEYLEHNNLVFISYYTKQSDGLAGYLLVIDTDGHNLLLEKTGEQLKGLGVDTFFILSGCLFFVRNKHELLSYQIL